MERLDRVYARRAELLADAEEQRRDIEVYIQNIMHPKVWTDYGISLMRGLATGGGILWLFWPGRRGRGMLALALALATYFARRR